MAPKCIFFKIKTPTAKQDGGPTKWSSKVVESSRGAPGEHAWVVGLGWLGGGGAVEQV